MHSTHTALQLATIFITAAVSIGALPVSQLAAASDISTFAVDPPWPRPLLNDWIIGQVGGTVDWQGSFR